MNPNAASFNPNARAFVPSWGGGAPQQQQPPPQAQQPQGSYPYPNQPGGQYNPQQYPPTTPPQGYYPNQYPPSGYPSYPPPQYGWNPNQPPPQQPPAPPQPQVQTMEEAKPQAPVVAGAKAEGRKAGTFVIGKKKTAEEAKKPGDESSGSGGGAKAETGATAPKEPSKPEEPKPKEVKPKAPPKVYKRDPRPMLNIVFCGHVDAGKSTISGHILYLTGNVDDRTMEKNLRDAEKRGRFGESGGYAYVMDLTEDERDRGKTHETGSGYFETEKKRYTILDAPGHKCFVASMIGGASQADVAILVVSTRRGEFETGFEMNGQTREHALLLKTCGVKSLVIGLNKMDDPTTDWSKERWDEIHDKLVPYLKTVGFIEGKNMVFMPMSGLKGLGLTQKSRCDPEKVGAYYSAGTSLLEYLDALEIAPRDMEANVRFPIQGRYRDEGKVILYGKLETGIFGKGDTLVLCPSKKEVVIDGCYVGEAEADCAQPGDFLHLKVRGIEEEDVRQGYVLCLPSQPLRAVWYFQAQIVLTEKPLLSVGFVGMMHIHAAEVEVTVDKILAKVDKKTSKILEKNPGFARQGDSIIARVECVANPVVIETYKDFERMGRFNLREEGHTIAFGVVTKLYETMKETKE